MTVTINPGLERRIQDLLETGEYPDADALLADALQLLEDHNAEELRAKLQLGIEQLDRGEGIAFTASLAAELRAEARERAARGEQPSPDVCP